MKLILFPWPYGDDRQVAVEVDAIAALAPSGDWTEIILKAGSGVIVGLPFAEVLALLQGEQSKPKGKVTAQTISYEVTPHEPKD